MSIDTNTLTDLALLLQARPSTPSSQDDLDWYTTQEQEPTHTYTIHIPLSIWKAIRACTGPRAIRRYFLSAVRYKLADPDPAAVLDAARDLLPLLERLRPHVLDAAHGDIAQEEYDALLNALRELLKT